MPKLPHTSDANGSEAELKELLFARGINSELVSRVCSKCVSLAEVTALCSKPESGLISPEESLFILRALKRKAIPQATVLLLLDESDSKCCICWNIDQSQPIVIHHIDQHAKTLDDSYENLVVLCPNHHAQVHTRWEISRQPYPADLIRAKKAEWVKAVTEFKAGTRQGPGRESHWSQSVRPTAPTPPRYFVGREKTLVDLKDRLSKPGERIALVGMPGVGKSSIAMKAAQTMSLEFPAGVFWGQFSGREGSSAAMALSWLKAIGVAVPGEQQLPEHLFPLLGSVLTSRMEALGHALLVLDDLLEEDLEEAKALIGTMPSILPILITSRHTTVPVSTDSQPLKIDVLDRTHSTQILEHFCSTVDFTMQPVLDRLLDFLDGLPLALELVAKQIQLRSPKPGFSLEGLVDCLEALALENLQFPGERSLVASFELSFQGMSEELQRTFTAIGVFAFGTLSVMPLSSVLQVQEPRAEDALDSLVHISVLNWGTEPGTYYCHSLMHRYAEYRGTNAHLGKDRASLIKRHTDFFYRYVQDIACNRPSNFGELEVAFDNVQRALGAAFRGERWGIVSELVELLWTETSFLSIRCYDSKALSMFEMAAAAARKLNNKKMEAAHLGNWGSALMRLDRFREAINLIEKAISMSKRYGSQSDLPGFYHNLGRIYNSLGEPERAISYLRLCLREASKRKDSETFSHGSGMLGIVYRGQGNFHEAAKNFELSAKIAKVTGDKFTEANNLSNLGLVHLDLGNLEYARRYVKEALEIAKAIGDRRGEGNRMGHLGNILMTAAMLEQDPDARRRQMQEATWHLEFAYKTSVEIGDIANQSMWLGNIGKVYTMASQPEKAFDFFRQALALAESIDYRQSIGLCNANLASVLIALKRFEESRCHLEKAKTIFADTGSRYMQLADSIQSKLEASKYAENA